ncbi:hypothetical protein M0805_009144 [Coniferiporia weirii]|nr:hypothetical protein M0805_009144 [Coniferiporia weirii]
MSNFTSTTAASRSGFHDLEKGSNKTPAEGSQSLQQKRGQERLSLHIPKQTLPVEPSQTAVHFRRDDRPQAVPGDELPRKEAETDGSKQRTRKFVLPFPDLQWIPKNFNKSRMGPVLRCAVAAWISLLLVLIPRTQRVLGTSSFIILIATFLSPPADPFIAVLEREIVLQLTVAGAYAWSCIGVRLANLARTEFNPKAELSDIIQGRYIEAAPSVICAVFLCVGTSILLYLRTRMGQGKPVIAAMILSCTAMDSALTIAPLYPYPNYELGRGVVVPVAFHSAIAILSSLIIFPESVHAQFRQRFRAVFTPLAHALRSQPELLNTPSDHPAFNSGLGEYNAHVRASETALGPLGATAHLMKKDISFGRFGAGDFKTMHELVRRLTVRANGMAFYFRIMDPSRHRFPGTPVATPVPSRQATPPTSPGDMIPNPSASGTPTGSITSRRRRYRHSAHPHAHHHHHHHHNALAHPGSLFHEVRARSPEHAVGVFESQAYLNLETRFAHAGADALRARMMGLLGASAGALLLCSADTLDYCSAWLQRVNDDRVWKRVLMGRRGKLWKEVVQDNEDVKDKLKACLEEFRITKRHLVLDMYRSAIDPKHVGSPSGEDPPPHRYLFQCYLYQYHLIHFVQDLIDFLDEISRLESTRQGCMLWLPMRPLRKIFSWSRWDPSDKHLEPEDDEDPDIISGIGPGSANSLGLTSRRDPDALPPRNTLGAISCTLYHVFSAFGHGNCVFAFKAGIMAGLLGLPAYLPQTAQFTIDHRYVWAIVLGQTTLSRFRGDTVFGLIARISSTFFGGLVGMIMWYISSGNGGGNPYGLAAVAAVCFPFFSFVRICYPGPPINVVFFFLTSQLVIGYSWQDNHLPSFAISGAGFEVAWRRFTLVTVGVTVAFVFSFLPPSTTLRHYLRTTYSTTAGQIGQLYCDIVSFASVRDKVKTEEIVENLGAVRMKLNRTVALRRNVAYEFSLQGKWPADRYKRVLEIQMEIAYLLSHLRSVEEHLEPEWARAFLRRTRFMESDFQGDILSVICMISIALRTGTSLPQITPCPLLDRFVASHDDLDDYDLPRSLTIDILENEQYLYFSVGVATAFGIVTRLDRLMLAVKELVGEQYHIHGVLNLSLKKTTERMYF